MKLEEKYYKLQFINHGGTESEVGIWALDKDSAIMKARKHIPKNKILNCFRFNNKVRKFNLKSIKL